MAGHSHWAGIKHKKAVVDAKRGKVFSKIAKQITVAARQGGGDPSMNLNLKYSIERARAANMPKDNIDRAIKKGTGELDGVSFEDIVYEGYGPGGVAVMLSIVTDNRNRSSGEIRKLFERYGGAIGKTGCVAWQFDAKAFVLVDATRYDEETVLESALEGGAEDMESADDSYEITGPPESLEGIRSALEAAGIETETAQVTNLPSATVTLNIAKGKKAFRMLQEFEDHDDVESTATNLDVTDELLAALEEEDS